ncbi:MAG TPA: polysaccharide pyruvyl transferase family protein, partial [Phenylobacterium sp.]|uniref:polysaccharide pyruvyl transferase family protein n=1 Tax=Phenylobacterium sp. TaxID=1871053 RepID=UPI002F94277E
GLMVKRRLRPRWREQLAQADALVLGGGNLLADADLNFPTKIDGVLAEAAAAGLPIGVYGVGVSDNWSKRGQALFERAMTAGRLTHVAVRDPLSKAIWDRRLGRAGVRLAEVAPDPAVLAARHFPKVAKLPGPPRVGLGVTNPLALRYHAADFKLRDEAFAAWIAQLAAAMAAEGWKVVLFTNGSPEDREYLKTLAPATCAAAPDAISVQPAFDRPSEMAAFLSGCDLVLAHRMHACITAYAYQVPHIGFAWDRKLLSFFESVGRRDFVASAGEASVDEVLALARRALEEGIDPAVHAAQVRAAERGVAALAASFAPRSLAAAEAGR